MLELSRTVRFCVNDDPPDVASSSQTPRHNNFSAWPAVRGLGRYYELTVCCRGEAEPRTGYFINIKHIDTAVRDHALPELSRMLRQTPHSAETPMGELMRGMHERLQRALDGTVASLALRLTPMVALTLESNHMDHILIKQQYEFSAAHRLHVPELSEQRNREVFGKCNNPAGHGHNYRVEVVVRAPIDAHGRTLAIEQLDAVVDTHAIEKLDHKHLNVDVPQFADRNPSVEHIAQVIWAMLDEPVRGLGPDVALEELSVWETGKTVCTYRGPGG